MRIFRYRWFEVAYLGTWCVLFIFLWRNMLIFDGEYYWTGWQNIWGDWSMHFPYIYNFLYRSFPLSYHPLYWGYPFHYHYAADFMTALLMKVGYSLVPAVLLQSIFFSIVLIFTVYIFYLRLYRDKIVASFALFLFFFNGGMGLILNIYNRLVSPSFQMTYEFTHIDDWNIRWVNFITGEFISQRPFLIGFPLAILILLLFWNIYQNNKHMIYMQFAYLGIATGLLPAIHIYSYFVILGVAIYLTILTIMQRKYTYMWFWYFVPLILISGLVFHFLIGKVPISYIRFDPGWMALDGILPFIWFWMRNIGVMSILIPISFFMVPRTVKIFSVPFIGLYILSNLFIFQPNEWDNRKFLLYWYFFSCGTVSYMLTQMYKKKKNITIILCIILFYTSVLSGMIDVISLLKFDRNKYRLFSVQDINFAQQIRNITDKESVFLLYPANSWIGMVLGRQTVMGFEAWVDNIGAATGNRKADIEKIYSGDASAQNLIKKYAVDYVFIGPQEHTFKYLNEEYFRNQFQILIRNDTYTIYDVRGVSGKGSIPRTSE